MLEFLGDLLDVPDKLSSIGGFAVALALFLRELRRGNNAMQVHHHHHHHRQVGTDQPEPFPEPGNRAEAFQQHRQWRAGMFLPAPVFIEDYKHRRRFALGVVIIGVVMFCFLSMAFLSAFGIWPPFPIWCAPVVIVGCGAGLMRQAANRINRRFPD